MKRKYYLRGIGVGILFATIILFVAYRVSGAGTLSDEEIIKRAEELGMVQEESVLDNLQKPAEEVKNTENPSTKDTHASEASSTETTTTEASTTEATTEATRPARTVSFTVVSGMNSWNVATILQDQGIIADASDFDTYLEQNGYSSRIVTGEYTVTEGMDYDAIAKMITGNE